MKNNDNMSVLLKGILKENPVLVLILGTCPTLATTNNVAGAFGMGIANGGADMLQYAEFLTS